MYLNEQCREYAKKVDGVITKNLRHFAFSRVYIRWKRKSKTPETSEIEFFVNLGNDWKLLAGVIWRTIKICPSKVCRECFIKSLKYLVAQFTISTRDNSQSV